MRYNNKTISEIAIQHARLKMSLEKLDNVRKDKDCVVFDYISAYVAAKESLGFLQTINRSIQEGLGLNELELELSEFNTTIKLFAQG